jgi:hypothetical protein
LLRPDPVKALSDVPDATKEPPGRPSPGRLSASEIEQIAEIGLKALVGSTEVPALVIPTGNGAVAETRFNLAKLRKYKAVRYDDNRIFLTEKHADLDREKNELATDWVQNYSDAAKDPNIDLPRSEMLRGPVYVVAVDPIMKRITKSTKQLKKLKRALQWKYPLRRTD